MELWVFVSAPRMGTTTLLNDVVRGENAARLRKSFKLAVDAKVAATYVDRRRKDSISDTLEGMDYQLHEWDPVEGTERMAKASRIIALHVSMREWARRYNAVDGGILRLTDVRWYYNELSNWASRRDQSLATTPVEHWDMEKRKFFIL